MSFSSSSSHGRPYRYGHNGSKHYKRKGLLGSLFSSFGSHRHSNEHYVDYHEYYDNTNYSGHSVGQTICSKCKASLPADAKFCQHCGERVAVAKSCPNCGQNVSPNDKFCLNCSAKL